MKEKILNDYYSKILPINEVKHFLRISGDHEDLLIKNLSKGVILFAENILGFELSQKEILLEGIFTSNLKLKNPFICINYVKNKEGSVEFEMERNILKPNLKIGSHLIVSYEAGFMEDEVGEDLKIALMQHLLTLYDIRTSKGRVPEISMEVYLKYKTVNL